MALEDIMPGAAPSTHDADVAQATADLGEAVNPPDPYAGTDLSRESLGRAEPAAETPPAETPPAAEVEPAPEQAERQRTVPHGAFEQERARRRASEQELQQLRGQVTAWQNAMNAEIERRQNPQAAQAEPDPDADPLAALKHLVTGLNEIKQNNARQAEQAQNNARVQHMLGQAAIAANEFSKARPDFQQAHQFALEMRGRQLALMGADPVHIPALVRNEETAFIARAFAMGRNPAEMAYELAKASGWQGDSSAGAATIAAVNNLAAAIPQRPAAAQAARAAAATALPNGSRPQRVEMTMEEALASGDPADFEKAFDRMKASSSGRRGKSLFDDHARR